MFLLVLESSIRRQVVLVDLGRDYSSYCSKFNMVWKYLVSCSKGVDEITNEICSHRLYFDSYGRWKNIFLETGVAFVSEDSCDYSKLKSKELEDLALFSKEGKFLLNKRYIFPIRDMVGNIIALVGWYPDSKRYITTPSKYFSKDCLFFGMEQIGKTGLNKDYFLVEGIFDCLSLRSLGYNAVAMMGISGSRVKKTMYGFFRKLVAIPDNDKQGRKVVEKDAWSLPKNASYFQWVGNIDLDYGENEFEIKDIDRFCSLFNEEDVKSVLNSAIITNSRVLKIKVN